ncbi:hypothetical protein [Hahella ganghwensis]|uniref:hypothetical protein n=1 Tax=Hahella ganghwensis TaxID=286420 RepID=UPI0003629A52|nr:hypothetical protein [Hahella ganghwensis]
MHNPAESIRAYLYAKDRNQPHRMAQAFSENASLEMNIRTEAISFPSSVLGRENITDVLVRRFAQTYENVYTLCLCPPPENHVTRFSCRWLVVMSEKPNRQIRIGCGGYDWTFQRETSLAEHLTITIEDMQVMPPESLKGFIDGVSVLPYPWCPTEQILSEWPQSAELENIRQYLGL